MRCFKLKFAALARSFGISKKAFLFVKDIQSSTPTKEFFFAEGDV